MPSTSSSSTNCTRKVSVIRLITGHISRFLPVRVSSPFLVCVTQMHKPSVPGYLREQEALGAIACTTKRIWHRQTRAYGRTSLRIQATGLRENNASLGHRDNHRPPYGYSFSQLLTAP